MIDYLRHELFNNCGTKNLRHLWRCLQKKKKHPYFYLQIKSGNLSENKGRTTYANKLKRSCETLRN